jgi:rSAM/selenodomain-associated transferase 1
LNDVLDVARRTGIYSVVAFTPKQSKTYFERIAPDFELMLQSGAGLGERMQRAISAMFSRGISQVVLIGSDLPHLSPQIIQQAFQELSQGAMATLGPSEDGGYYLIGLRQPCPQIFAIEMSTPRVLRQTVELIRQAGLPLARLPETFDVDTIADLGKLWITLERHTDIPATRTRGWLKKNQAVMQQLFPFPPSNV